MSDIKRDECYMKNTEIHDSDITEPFRLFTSKEKETTLPFLNELQDPFSEAIHVILSKHYLRK